MSAARLAHALAQIGERARLAPPSGSSSGPLRDLHEACDGTAGNELAANLLSQRGSREATASIATREGWESFVLFAADASGNFAGVCAPPEQSRWGPLAGMVCIFDHDDERVAPAFTSVASFVERLASSDAVDLLGLPTDYPRIDRAPADHAERERALFELYRNRYAEKRDRSDAWIALALAPGELSALEPFLTDRDAWVQEQACIVAAKLCGDAAIPVLSRLAVEGAAPNLPITCLSALRRMKTPDASRALEDLRPALGGAFGAYFPRRK